MPEPAPQRLLDDDGRVIARPPAELEHLTQTAIDNCDLCDPDGYRNGGIVCDHIDRTATAARGIAACRAALTSRADNTPPTP